MTGAWPAVYQQTRWLAAGVFETSIADLRVLIRLGDGRSAEPSAVIFAVGTCRARRKGGAVRLGRSQAQKGRQSPPCRRHAWTVAGRARHPGQCPGPGPGCRTGGCAPAGNGRDGDPGLRRSGYTGEASRQAAVDQRIALAVVKLPEAKRGFVLLPRRWVVERDFGWMSRFRRLARDQERLAEVLKGFHLLAFSMLMWKQVLPLLNVL
jgi:transposase